MPAPASLFGAIMALITGNAGGNIQVLPRVTVNGSRKRNFCETILLANQPAGSVIAVARLPKAAVITGISVVSDTSLGAATIQFGDVNAPAQFGAAQTYTTPQARVIFGSVATLGVPLDGPNYDAVTGQVSQAYEDVVMTVGAAALPGAGTMRIITDWAID